jgi:hypothetical protein
MEFMSPYMQDNNSLDISRGYFAFLNDKIREQVLPDGMHLERSPMK